MCLQNKCAKYWPDLGENPMMFNDLYVVESMRSEEAESYCLTYLTLHNLEVRVSVVAGWPDWSPTVVPSSGPSVVSTVDM